jgi:hypothetical protein
MNFEEWCKANSIILFCVAITFFLMFLILFTLFSTFYLSAQLKKNKSNKNVRNNSLTANSSVQSRDSTKNYESVSEYDIYEKQENKKPKKQVIQFQSANDEEKNITTGILYPSNDKFNNVYSTRTKNRQNMLTPISIISEPIFDNYPRKLKRKLSDPSKFKKKLNSFQVKKKGTESIDLENEISEYDLDVSKFENTKLQQERRNILTPLSITSHRSYISKPLKGKRKFMMKNQTSNEQSKKISKKKITPSQIKPIYQNDGENIQLAKEMRRHSSDVESEF